MKRESEEAKAKQRKEDREGYKKAVTVKKKILFV